MKVEASTAMYWLGGGCWKLVLLTVSMTPLMAACADVREYKWTEDVRLSNGRTSLVQREEEYRRTADVGAGFKPAALLQRARMVAHLPSPIGQEVSFAGSLSPLVLDVVAGQAYLVCRATTARAVDEWKLKPNELYVVFLWKTNQWMRISIDELPHEVHPNLLPSGYQLFIKQGASSGVHVDLARKERLIQDLRLPDSDPIKVIARPKRR